MLRGVGSLSISRTDTKLGRISNLVIWRTLAEILGDVGRGPVDILLETDGGMTDATEALISMYGVWWMICGSLLLMQLKATGPSWPFRGSPIGSSQGAHKRYDAPFRTA